MPRTWLATILSGQVSLKHDGRLRDIHRSNHAAENIFIEYIAFTVALDARNSSEQQTIEKHINDNQLLVTFKVVTLMPRTIGGLDLVTSKPSSSDRG
jgi:hypothetical protein